MFSKFFSKKDSKKEQAEQLKEVILNYFASYRSQVFPNGLLIIEQNLQVKLVDNHVEVVLKVPFPCQSELDDVSHQLSIELEEEIHIEADIHVLPVRKHELPKIKNIIAVSSGKGGVGKSTTSVNLAFALIEEGAKVGILDADIYGPSIPTMLGLVGEKPTSEDGKNLIPMLAEQLHAMSIGFLMEEDDATVWRGPMASRALNQLLNETAWPELDYLIIDMPPGTGDIQLTLAQQIPVAAAVVITTPQDIALADASKGITMFNKVNIPVLGIIENMSYHTCENCGHQSHLFGQGGGEKIADKFQTKLLGQLPLDISVMQASDSGNSIILSDSNSDITSQYRKIAKNLAAQLFHAQDARSAQNTSILIKEL